VAYLAEAKEIYDAVVIGSGAGGATAAYVLVNHGLKVLLLEAGRMLHPPADFLTHTMPWELPFRGHGKPGEYDGPFSLPARGSAKLQHYQESESPRRNHH
jgi:choline dehydrogenase-like flavoprotein